MRLHFSYQKVIIECVCLLYVLLFVYAAVSKLLDFENFQIQIGQSPLLSSFAGPVSYGVPGIELFLSILLFSTRYRRAALYGCFLMMVMFSAYILIILNYSSFVPCSCGGILEQMSWTEHLIFNLFFVLLAAVGLFLDRTSYFVIGYLLIHFVSGVSVVGALFLLSEDIMEHRNDFVRRYPNQVTKGETINMGFNSYYFAGASKASLYLGNYTAPLLLTKLDTFFSRKKELVVQIDSVQLPFRSLELRVQKDVFYAVDGTIPHLFRGQTSEWKAKSMLLSTRPFSVPTFIDSSAVVYRTHSDAIESVLGITTLNQNSTSFQNPLLLQKQIDGLFDSDGTLLYDSDTQKIVYLYRYRNQFVVANSKLQLLYRGKTIDTISTAQIKVAYNAARDEKKLSAPPLTVNRNGFVYRGLLFVHAALIGKFEDRKMWRQTSVVDVYDIKRNTYLESFYVYDVGGTKMRRFYVYQSSLYALVGSDLVRYTLSPSIKKRFYVN